LHERSVLKWVLVGGRSSERSGSNSSELALNLVRVDDSSEISDSHQASVELVTSLFNTLLSVGSEDLVEVSKGILSEDNESAEVAAWGELQKVKSVDAASINTRKISCGSLQKRILITVHDEGTLSQNEARVSHLVLTGT